MEGSHICMCHNRPLRYSAFFFNRYCFLGFGWKERVVASRDTCRLLLVRLKMDGWALGKTKVFLKYYHVEYLSKLYEDQVSHVLRVVS
jgi:myosin-3